MFEELKYIISTYIGKLENLWYYRSYFISLVNSVIIKEAQLYIFFLFYHLLPESKRLKNDKARFVFIAIKFENHWIGYLGEYLRSYHD